MKTLPYIIIAALVLALVFVPSWDPRYKDVGPNPYIDSALVSRHEADSLRHLVDALQATVDTIRAGRIARQEALPEPAEQVAIGQKVSNSISLSAKVDSAELMPYTVE